MNFPNSYELSEASGRIDRDAVWQFMTEHAAWGRWRTRKMLDQQIDESWRVVGAFETATEAMVGFARAVSDGISLAYLADVYVLPDHRGHGLGAALVKLMIDDGPGAHFRWMLHTADAHRLYARFGFTEPNETYLERPGGAPARSNPRSSSSP